MSSSASTPLIRFLAHKTDAGQSCDVSTYLPISHRLRRLCTDCYSLDTTDEDKAGGHKCMQMVLPERQCTGTTTLTTLTTTATTATTTATTTSTVTTTTPTVRTGKERFCACEAGVERVCPECPWVWQETAAAGEGEGEREGERERGRVGEREEQREREGQGHGECWVCDRQVGPRERGGGWFCLWCERPCGDVGREPAAVVRVVGNGE